MSKTTTTRPSSEAVNNRAKKLGLVWHEGKCGWAFPDDPESSPPRPIEYPYMYQIKTDDQMDWFIRHNSPGKPTKR